MTTPEETTAPAAVEPPTNSNPFLSADDVHDKAAHLVLDTSPFLRGGALKLRTLANKFYTIPEVLNEIRDKQARDDLAILPFDIEVINPTEASVRTVAAFARKTGDYAVLSATDLRVLALTYQLEFQHCGMKRIRTEPLRPNVQAGNKPTPPKRTKHSAKEITGEFSDEESTNKPNDDQTQENTNSQSNTVLEEGPESDDEDEGEIQEMTEQLGQMTATEAQQEEQGKPSSTSAVAESSETSQDTTVNTKEEEEDANEGNKGAMDTGKENDDEDDGDGEWITSENLKKVKRYGTSKPKKKARQPILMQVACTTGDFAMQNVLLQMGLNLLSVDGLRISKVKSWVLRCHACTKVTSNMEKKFCPSCGNATLMRTSTSTDQNGNVKYYLKTNMVYNLRGTKYSIPTPQGGRKNNDLILREDQREYELSLKFQRRQKKIDALDPDYAPRLLEGQIDSRNPFGAPVIGYGKRNPNAAKKSQLRRRR